MLRLDGMCRYVGMLFCFLSFGLILSNWYLSRALLLLNQIQFELFLFLPEKLI